jgi:hypothetical protein
MQTFGSGLHGALQVTDFKCTIVWLAFRSYTVAIEPTSTLRHRTSPQKMEVYSLL